MQGLSNFATLLLRCVLAFFRSRREQAIVELALRQQLATYAQARPKPRLTSLDRVFWVALHRLWPRWKEVLVIVKPETVIRWHRKGFRLYWRALSRADPPPCLREWLGGAEDPGRALQARLHHELGDGFPLSPKALT
jgi:hypothetical protein